MPNNQNAIPPNSSNVNNGITPSPPTNKHTNANFNQSNFDQEFADDDYLWTMPLDQIPSKPPNSSPSPVLVPINQPNPVPPVPVVNSNPPFNANVSPSNQSKPPPPISNNNANNNARPNSPPQATAKSPTVQNPPQINVNQLNGHQHQHPPTSHQLPRQKSFLAAYEQQLQQLQQQQQPPNNKQHPPNNNTITSPKATHQPPPLPPTTTVNNHQNMMMMTMGNITMDEIISVTVPDLGALVPFNNTNNTNDNNNNTNRSQSNIGSSGATGAGAAGDSEIGVRIHVCYSLLVGACVFMLIYCRMNRFLR